MPTVAAGPSAMAEVVHNVYVIALNMYVDVVVKGGPLAMARERSAKLRERWVMGRY